MNAKKDGWELYTDLAGRRHWRWPAPAPQMGAGISGADAGPRRKIGTLRQQQAQPAPRPLPGK